MIIYLTKAIKQIEQNYLAIAVLAFDHYIHNVTSIDLLEKSKVWDGCVGFDGEINSISLFKHDIDF